MALRNHFYAFHLFHLFCILIGHHLNRHFALATIWVNFYSPELGPDRIPVNVQQIADQITRTNAELEAAKNASILDATKIESLDKKMANLRLVHRALQIDIPNFYNQHYKMWNKLKIARNVLQVIHHQNIDRYLSPPYTWIVRAAQRYVDDWDANSISKYISQIISPDETVAIDQPQFTSVRDYAIVIAKPVKNLNAFLNSLPWNAFIAYLGLTLRIAPYRAYMLPQPTAAILDANSRKSLNDFLNQVEYLLSSLANELSELMRQKEYDPLLLKKIRNINIVEKQSSSPEVKLAIHIDYLNDNIVQQFRQFDKSLNMHTEIFFDNILAPKTGKLISPDASNSFIQKMKNYFAGKRTTTTTLPRNAYDDRAYNTRTPKSSQTTKRKKNLFKKRNQLTLSGYGASALAAAAAAAAGGGGFYLWKLFTRGGAGNGGPRLSGFPNSPSQASKNGSSSFYETKRNQILTTIDYNRNRTNEDSIRIIVIIIIIVSIFVSSVAAWFWLNRKPTSCPSSSSGKSSVKQSTGIAKSNAPSTSEKNNEEDDDEDYGSTKNSSEGSRDHVHVS